MKDNKSEKQSVEGLLKEFQRDNLGRSNPCEDSKPTKNKGKVFKKDGESLGRTRRNSRGEDFSAASQEELIQKYKKENFNKRVKNVFTVAFGIVIFGILLAVTIAECFVVYKFISVDFDKIQTWPAITIFNSMLVQSFLLVRIVTKGLFLDKKNNNKI